MLMDPRRNVLMKLIFPPLTDTSFVFTFHEEGLYDFICPMHRPEMNRQILVLPPRPPEDQQDSRSDISRQSPEGGADPIASADR
jgi:hypothetical protein